MDLAPASTSWIAHIHKLSGTEDWEKWNGTLEAQLTLADLWDALESKGKISEQDKRNCSLS